MKPGADFEQARDAAAQCDPARSRLGDAREDLEQGRFAGAVAADDAEDLALLDLEADILERPEFLDLIALHDLPAAHDIGSLARGVAQMPLQHVAEIGEALVHGPLGTVPDQIAL